MMTCSFLWSVAGLFIKVLDWNPFLITGMRSLIAFFFLLTIDRAGVRPGLGLSTAGRNTLGTCDTWRRTHHQFGDCGQPDQRLAQQVAVSSAALPFSVGKNQEFCYNFNV